MPILCATVVRFKRDEHSPWESGIALTSEPGLSNVSAIMPITGRCVEDIPLTVWDYNLDPSAGAFVLAEPDAEAEQPVWRAPRYEQARKRLEASREHPDDGEADDLDDETAVVVEASRERVKRHKRKVVKRVRSAD